MKNQIKQVIVEDMTHMGEGVAKVEGFPLFIPHGLPGDRLEVEVTAIRKKFGFARILRIIAPSPSRVVPRCEIFGTCGGCQTMSLCYEAQLAFKEKRVKDSLQRIGKINATHEPILGMDDPWYYRNKAQFPVGGTEDQVKVGFYQQGTHEIVDAETCYIQHPVIDLTRKVVRGFMNDHRIPVYDETTGKGLIRHLVTKIGFATGEVMVVMVINGNALPHQDDLVNRLKKEIPGLVSVCINRNTQKTNVVMGKDFQAIYGKAYLTDRLDQLQFQISPHAFFQVNPQQTVKLYNKVLEYAELDQKDKVLDVYCGIGTITLMAAQKAGHVTGIESVKAAVDDAHVNARLNHIDNVDFVAGRAEEIMGQYAASGFKPRVIIVDPPRKGCDEAVLKAMADMDPERIVYVSCNPATLARDLNILKDYGYKTLRVQPVDMFSHSTHVETVCLLTRK